MLPVHPREEYFLSQQTYKAIHLQNYAFHPLEFVIAEAPQRHARTQC